MSKSNLTTKSSAQPISVAKERNKELERASKEALREVHKKQEYRKAYDEKTGVQAALAANLSKPIYRQGRVFTEPGDYEPKFRAKTTYDFSTNPEEYMDPFFFGPLVDLHTAGPFDAIAIKNKGVASALNKIYRKEPEILLLFEEAIKKGKYASYDELLTDFVQYYFIEAENPNFDYRFDMYAIRESGAINFLNHLKGKFTLEEQEKMGLEMEEVEF